MKKVEKCSFSSKNVPLTALPSPYLILFGSQFQLLKKKMSLPSPAASEAQHRSNLQTSVRSKRQLPGPSIATKIFGDVVIRIENWDIDTQSPIA